MAAGISVEGLAELRAALVSMDSTLTRSLDEALLDSARLVATSAQSKAPRRSGRLRGSITPVLEGAVGEVRVTARRASRRYPGGYPYPVKIERSRPFLAPAVVQEAARIEERMTKVLDDIATKWKGA